MNLPSRMMNSNNFFRSPLRRFHPCTIFCFSSLSFFFFNRLCHKGFRRTPFCYRKNENRIGEKSSTRCIFHFFSCFHSFALQLMNFFFPCSGMTQPRGHSKGTLPRHTSMARAAEAIGSSMKEHPAVTAAKAKGQSAVSTKSIVSNSKKNRRREKHKQSLKK